MAGSKGRSSREHEEARARGRVGYSEGRRQARRTGVLLGERVRVRE